MLWISPVCHLSTRTGLIKFMSNVHKTSVWRVHRQNIRSAHIRAVFFQHILHSRLKHEGQYTNQCSWIPGIFSTKTLNQWWLSYRCHLLRTIFKTQNNVYYQSLPRMFDAFGGAGTSDRCYVCIVLSDNFGLHFASSKFKTYALNKTQS